MSGTIDGKLKVLWIADKPISLILKELEPNTRTATGGWLEGASKEILDKDEIRLSYCFQYPQLCEGEIESLNYFSMPVSDVVRRKQVEYFRDKDYERFKVQLEKVNPDVIHIFGTETWFHRQFVFMLDRLDMLDHTIVWIQGLTSFCANVFADGLSERDINRTTLWELIRGTNVAGIRKRLRLNGISETEEIKLLKNVFTRTDWDTACCRAINRDLRIYHCNETLRASFYDNKIWNIKAVEKHSIFISQCSTPLKGFHQMLRAMAIIVQRYPDAVLYTTGANVFKEPSKLIHRVKRPSFYRTIKKMIESLNLEKHIKFLGTLMEEEMRDRYVKSHVFVSASSIENSPNSVGEAMILGVPIVASDVGGVSSLLKHKEDGLLYPFSEYTMLADYVCRIFKDDDLALNFSQNARKRALGTHDREKNYSSLINAYRNITGPDDETRNCF